jgi:FtsP/CotA-like multicopper oxidase with cupredoxin domain
VSGTFAAGLTLGGYSRAAAPAAVPRVLRVTKSGYDGKVPGPQLRVKRGEEFAVRVVNELDEPTAVHWHGVRVPNAMDGAPSLTQAPIPPGASFDYRFVAPDAGTFWYHPPFPNGADLYGALIVEETQPPDVDQDISLIYAGSHLSADGWLKVNGVDDFVRTVSANQRVRLRVVNGTATQIMKLRMAALRVLVIAIDGQAIQPFAARDGELTLGPGNRIDATVDCTIAPGDMSAAMRIEGADRSSFPVVRILCDPKPPGRLSPRDDPKSLPSNPLPERMDFRDAFRLEAAIGQIHADKKDQPLFTVRRGRTVMLGLSNPTSANGFIHLHGHSFRLLDALDDGWKPFWLDTMPMEPRGKARIAFVADNPGKWLIEGLDETGAAAWFEVT